MTDVNFVLLLTIFSSGLIVGVALTLAYNKFRSGSASPASVKKEFDDYQQKVEAHFDETSDKFRAMAEQYKDLYQHLSVGATSLCRPEHISPALKDGTNPLQSLPKQEGESTPAAKAATQKQSVDKKDSVAKKDSATKGEQKKPNASNKRKDASPESNKGQGAKPQADSASLNKAAKSKKS